LGGGALHLRVGAEAPSAGPGAPHCGEMCWGQCPYLEAEGEGQAATARRSARKCPLRRPRGGGANADAVRRTVDEQKRWPSGRPGGNRQRAMRGFRRADNRNWDDALRA